MKKDIQLLWFNDYDKMNENEKRTVVIKGQTDYLTDGLAKELGVKGLQEGIKKDRFSIDGICHRCYNHPCSCEVKITYENPYTVKRQQDLKPNTKKEYEQAVKNAVLRALEDKK